MISTTRRLFQGRKTAIFLLVSFISLITFSYISTIRSETFIYHYNHYKFSSKQVYVEAALSTSVDGPFDDSSLRVLCANTTWVPGIIFSCTSPKGDGAEMRNAVLTCVRFAIEGGGALVVPNLLVHDFTTTKITYAEREFSHLFDTDHFMASLNAACPQMRVYRHINDLYDLPSTSPAVKLTPESLIKESHANFITNMKPWRQAFYSFLETSSPPFSSEIPIRIDLQLPELPIFSPTSHDPDHLTSNFGRLLFAKPSTCRLAASVLYTLSRTFGWHLPPSDGIVAHAFAAFLLPDSKSQVKNSKDKEKSDTHLESLMDEYMNHTLSLGLKVIYLSGNNVNAFQLLSSLAAPNNVSIFTASSLLAGDEFDLLNSLAPEQKALVDHEIFLRASTFGGSEDRLEAWGISLRRHKLSGKVDWLSDSVGESRVIGDEWSVIWGEKKTWSGGERGMVLKTLWP